MAAYRKITITLPEELIAGAQSATGVGLTETISLGLERLRRDYFYDQMRQLRGKVDFGDITIDELREDSCHIPDGLR